MDAVQFRKHFNVTPLSKTPSLSGMGILNKPVPLPSTAHDKSVIVVDTFTTGAVVAHEAMKRGYVRAKLTTVTRPSGTNVPGLVHRAIPSSPAGTA